MRARFVCHGEIPGFDSEFGLVSGIRGKAVLVDVNKVFRGRSKLLCSALHIGLSRTGEAEAPIA